MIRNAADEYGAAGVRFNAIQPEFIATEVMEAIEPDGPVWQSYVAAELRSAASGSPRMWHRPRVLCFQAKRAGSPDKFSPSMAGTACAGDLTILRALSAVSARGQSSTPTFGKTIDV